MVNGIEFLSYRGDIINVDLLMFEVWVFDFMFMVCVYD